MTKKNIIILVLLSTLATYIVYNKNQQQNISQKKIDQKNSLSLVKNNNTGIKNSQKDNKIYPISPETSQLWLNNDKQVPVKDYLDELIEAAESGDSTAQYHISIVQRDCINIPDSEDSLTQRLQNLSDKEQEYLIDEYDWCEGYPRNLLSEKDWKNMIIKAARGGNSKAKIEFLAASFSMMTPSELVSKSELVTELKREGVNHLIDAKNMGEKDALIQLAMTYHDGHMVQKDLKEAYAYYYAFSQFTSTNFHRPDMVSIENELNIKQLQDAIKRGEKYENCCN